jgi:[acyl-carrier-protein] S-malonyltransferase
MASENAAMGPAELRERLSSAAFVFRGYNVTNLGRSRELLEHPVYGPIVHGCLKKGGAICSEIVGKRVDLVSRVRRQQETTLKTYADAIALIMSMEEAQLELLREFFDIEVDMAFVAYGYSLGEICAVAACHVIDMEHAMRVPLSLAHDCAELARDVTLGVLFSRGRTVHAGLVRRLCQEINLEGRGVIGISGLLAPNSMLMMGQADTLDRFKQRIDSVVIEHPSLRKSMHRFPPLHTPIMWQRCIPNRAAVLMQSLPGGLVAPRPQLLSLVTGDVSYDDSNAREILHQWVDHPQRLWDAVYWTLTHGVETVIHVGPEPNLVPATYKRLRDNVEAETRGRVGMRALKAVVHHPWVKPLLPQRTALLRAPTLQQIILEDWLLAQKPES